MKYSVFSKRKYVAKNKSHRVASAELLNAALEAKRGGVIVVEEEDRPGGYRIEVKLKVAEVEIVDIDE